MTPWHALVYSYVMISKPNQTQLRALAALNRAPGWTDITAFLDDELQAVYLHLANSRDDAILKQMIQWRNEAVEAENAKLKQ